MKRMLSFLMTLALLALASTTLAETHLWRCQYCGNTASSISELMARKCPKGPYETCLAVYNEETPKSNATSNYTMEGSYPSPIRGNTITLDGREYTLSSLEWAIQNRFSSFIYRTYGGGPFMKHLPKSIRKHRGEIWDAVMDLWNGLKSGRVEFKFEPRDDYWVIVDYNNRYKYGHLIDHEGARKNKEYYGIATGYLVYEIMNAESIVPRTRIRGYFNYNSENEIKKKIDDDNDAFCGIYLENSYKKIACIKSKGEYYLVCVVERYSSTTLDPKLNWFVGDIVAKLERTASANTFTSKIFWDKNAYGASLYFITFDGYHLRVAGNGTTHNYFKTYPTAN